MSRPIVKIHNLETNEVIEREMNDAEFLQFQSDQEIKTAKVAEEAAKAQARQALLDKLGITEEEAKLLLG